MEGKGLISISSESKTLYFRAYSLFCLTHLGVLRDLDGINQNEYVLIVEQSLFLSWVQSNWGKVSG